MSDSTAVAMRDVALSDAEAEKQPMTAANSEKNGSVKVKIPEDESKFTGLSKEQLLQVAGTPGWVRTRWVLLILFWIGWLGMLAGAIAIIVQAPRCKPIPEMNWWNFGSLYQIGDVKAFTESSNVSSLTKAFDELEKLKVKGLIIGPLHVSAADDPTKLKLREISSEAGSLEDFRKLIKEAHRKGISVVLDVTPNYKGKEPWFTEDAVKNVTVQLKSALVHWLETGVDGFLLYGVDEVFSAAPSSWSDINFIVHNHTEGEKKKVLIGVTDKFSPDDVAEVLNSTGVDLLLSGALRSKSAMEVAQAVDHLYSTYNQTQLAWNIGERVNGHLASLVAERHVKLNQLLLLTLPGTPVFNYGDEKGLKDGASSKYPLMVWKNITGDPSESEMEKSQAFFKSVSDKRSKERSLLHGEYLPLFSSSTALAYVRRWDQSERYLVALNWNTEAVTLHLKHAEVPEQATVVLSTTDTPADGETLQLAELQLQPNQGVMLKFPYNP